MAKVTLMGPRRLLMGTLDLLHSLGSVHLDPFPIPVEHRMTGAIWATREGELPAHLREDLLALRERIDHLLVYLPPVSFAHAPSWLFTHNIAAPDLKDHLAQAEEDIGPVAEEHLTLKEEFSTLSRYQKVLAALYPLLQDVTEVRHLELMGVILERKRAGILPLVERELARITSGQSQIFTGVMDKDNLAAILAYPPDKEAIIRELFSEENIAEIRLPETYANMPLAATLRLLIRRLKELPRLIALKAETLRELSFHWRSTLRRMLEVVEERLDEMRTMGLSAQSGHAFFVRGWIPDDRVGILTRVMSSNFGGEVLVEVTPAANMEFDQVPIHLQNNTFARFFEPLVRLLSLPRYGTVDPTPFMAYFFPLFFGFILGDIGYGVVLLALAFILRWKKADNLLFRNVTGIFILSGISAIVFGLLFGEFFGNLGEHFGLHPLLIDRAKVFMPILYAAIALGYVHIVLGFFLSLVMNLRLGHSRHWAAAAGNIALLVGLLFVLLPVLGLLPRSYLVGGSILAGLGLVLVILTEGLMGPLEFLKTFGNILSYSRLMAIGISSVILAQVANMIGGVTGSFFLGVAVALVFHSLNFALGVFSPSIHSLRLHYVEFFGKFYQPGGRPYQPFHRHEVV